jgi:hypothetical protein
MPGVGVRSVFAEARHGRRDFIRPAFAALAGAVVPAPLSRKFDCLSSHGIDHERVGPGLPEVWTMYATRTEAARLPGARDQRGQQRRVGDGADAAANRHRGRCHAGAMACRCRQAMSLPARQWRCAYSGHPRFARTFGSTMMLPPEGD